MKQNIAKLGNLDIYKMSLELSDLVWNIYLKMDYQTKKIMGDQSIRSIDSIGANIAEGYGRYHYLDKVRFYYNVRGSLFESKHWVFLLGKRNIISFSDFNFLIIKLNKLHEKLNAFIKSVKVKK